MALFCCVAQLIAAGLMLTTEQGWDYSTIMLLGFPVVGAVIVSRRPRNTIGWLLVVCGASVSLGLFLAAIVFSTLAPTPLLWQELLAWVTNIVFIGGFEGLLLTVAFLFPTGRPLSPGWRRAAIAVWSVFVVTLLIPTFRPGQVGGYFSEYPELSNPLGIPGVDRFSEALGILFFPLGLAVVLTSIAAMAVRWRRARGVERLQLQWLALAIGLTGIAVVTSAIWNALAPDDLSWVTEEIDGVFFTAGTLGISAAIGISILRYRLYDIERLINRGLVYLALTAALVVVYLGLVLLLGGALRTLTGASSGIVTAASTLAVAALFTPLRAGIQRIVDRRFYRRKYDAARMVEDFSARLRDEVDLDALSLDLQSVVYESMQPSHVSLWLRPTTHR